MKKMQIWLWVLALCVGVAIGLFNVGWVNETCNFIATVYTRLFRLLAVPTIVLAVITTLASLGGGKEMGKMFRTALTWTMATTFAAAFVGLGLYQWIKPGNLPVQSIQAEIPAHDEATHFSYADHILSVIPDNIVKPLLDGNVLALLILCFAVGIAISKMADSEPKHLLTVGLNALQDLLYMMIRWLIVTLPLGIFAFAEQLTSQIGGGLILESLGKYTLVVIGGNVLQIFVVLPLFLIGRGLNPLKCIRSMTPAIIMAFFTKSSAATLPVTIDNAENRLHINPKVARFVLPICTTINMNGCAAFILITSLFIMQNNGMPLSWPTMLIWVCISVLAAFGNAGVPMGCYFLTLSLMAGIGADISIMGIILPIYTIIDMVETAENVWSDSCVCAITGKAMKKEFPSTLKRD